VVSFIKICKTVGQTTQKTLVVCECHVKDARSAVVKEATDLIGTLFTVKLQPQPSLVMDTEDATGRDTINGASYASKRTPPPAFVGRLLLKDLIPTILDLSKQTVKLIRTEAVSLMLDILPHCRVKSVNIILLEVCVESKL